MAWTNSERVQPRTGQQAHVHVQGELALLQRVQQRTAEQVVHVPLVTVSESFVEQLVGVAIPCGCHVPQQRAQQRIEQVVDVHVPLVTVPERIVEQVVDVSMPSVGPVSSQDPQLERLPTRAASSSLDAPQGILTRFVALFPDPQKVRTLGDSRLPESSRSRAHTRRRLMAVTMLAFSVVFIIWWSCVTVGVVCTWTMAKSSFGMHTCV